MEGWHDFFVAEAGASAALAGLVFVGVSINLTRIMATPSLPSRALEALYALVTVLLTATLLLVPGESLQVVGIELLVVGIASWLAMSWVLITALRITEPEYRRYWPGPAALAQLSTLPLIVAGVWVLLYGVSGIYWTVPAVICSFLVAALNSWVLLVEIQR